MYDLPPHHTESTKSSIDLTIEVLSDKGQEKNEKQNWITKFKNFNQGLNIKNWSY